jgi:hypothetical protein
MSRLALQTVAVATTCLAAIANAQTTRSFHADQDLAFATFRIAITNGQLTSHGAAAPDVICLSRRASHEPSGANRPYSYDPQPAVLARLRRERRTTTLQPGSVCRTEQLGSAPRHTSLVVDTTSGRRGIRVWIDEPVFTAPNVGTIDMGYYEHGLSSAHWQCAVRRLNAKWVVNACQMLSIS